jgi:ubiquitin carboxyl-terminal hydrolase 48
MLEVRQENEVVESDSDSGETRTRDEGRGFGGTLLVGGSDRASSSPDKGTPPLPAAKSCSACTFSNESDAIECSMCETLFM